VRVVVGIGANLGDRLATMREAVARLGDVPGVSLVARSRVYETAPVGGPPQPAFLNAAIAVDCTLSPIALLDALQHLEAELGRTRSAGDVRWGPRLIDLDVLWIEGLTLDEPRLVVPHPRLQERAFAMCPLLDVAPGAYALPPALARAGVCATALEL
jgi:2-amino-4-hydroxy-6-hydroxymethyldihydropteridine diphosphokinase